ncbi:uncharacterized protein LOC106665364 isoform X3 [Cimex lectularius]|uniref:Uncharacterized protein n=1 Tax=Cimex lectularius TaxID=79782 RepID=A0A8I6RKP3_CIMLE|nr:uncharacterized protein LOC106665364 isoform X3 [Cimex lectularius]
MRTSPIFLTVTQVIKPHIPLIKFRKGHVDSCHTTQTPQQSSQGVSAAKPAKSTSYSLEEYQLPARFRRLPLDNYEIEAINGLLLYQFSLGLKYYIKLNIENYLMK